MAANKPTSKYRSVHYLLSEGFLKPVLAQGKNAEGDMVTKFKLVLVDFYETVQVDVIRDKLVNIRIPAHDLSMELDLTDKALLSSYSCEFQDAQTN